MPDYTAPPTWGSGPWPFSDANTYIRDNMKAMRNLDAAAQTFSDSGLTGTTTPTFFASHANLCAVAPTETSRLQVVCQIFLAPSVANVVTAGVYTQAGVAISANDAQFNCVNLAITQSFTIIGGTTFASGQNPGFKIRLLVSTTSQGISFQTHVLVLPTHT